MKQLEFISIQSPFDIDIEKSCFIEASAGTGKTYNLIRLFLRYVLEKEIDFEKILMVTFTKKATLEMTDRLIDLIRDIKNSKTLNGKLLSNPQIKILENILKNIDKLNIYTIHGFCNSLLKQYSFDLKIPFSTKIITKDNHYIYEILYEIIINNKLRESIFEKEFSEIEIDFKTLSEYIIKFINEGKRLKDYKLNFGIYELKFSEIIDKEAMKNILLDLKSKMMANPIQEEFKKIYIYVNLFYYVYHKLNEKKNMDGVITYDDMVYKVYEAIQKNKNFLSNLQKKYKVGIIDEFQDTDFIQWEIFSKVFLEKKGNYLVVVGDPKQAIYGFRGADIYSYFNAKNQLRKKSNLYVLDKNFRSNHILLKNINDWFQFLFQKGNIPKLKKYLERYYPLIPNDNSQENGTFGIYLIPIVKNKSKDMDKLRREFSQSIASSIEQFVLEEKIRFSDIAILYRSYNEILYLKNELSKKQIPYVLFSDEIIFNTEEAEAFELLLAYLAFQDDQIIRNQFIFYYFLQVPYTDIKKYETLFFRIQEIVSEWVPILKEKNWYRIFYKIIEDTKLYYKYIALNNYDQKISNFEQLIEIVLSLTSGKKLSPVDLYYRFKFLKNKAEKEIEENENISLVRLSSEENKVQIMSIHKSKGLEFPVVFLVGWLSETAPKTGDHDNYKFFSDDEFLWNVVFFEFLNERENKEKKVLQNKIRDELFFEEFRVFYVGMTRAKSKIILPYIQSEGGNEKSSSYMHEFIRNAADPNQIKLLKNLTSKTSINKNIDNTASMSNNVDEGVFSIIDDTYKNIKSLLEIDYQKRVSRMVSYSSLIKEENEEGIIVQDLDMNVVHEEEEDTSELESFLKSGAKTGNFVHELFEKITFLDFKEMQLQDLKNKYSELILKLNLKHRAYDYNNEDKKEEFLIFMINFIKDVLNNHIHFSKEFSFSLVDIDPFKSRKECNFLIQDIYQNNIIQPLLKNVFFTGSLDLFFEHNHHFFLLDYKTNKLTNYAVETLKEYTDKHYSLQYTIYSYSLYLWLHQIKNISLDEKLPGGIIYYYVRGYKKESKGICLFPFPSFKELQVRLQNYGN